MLITRCPGGAGKRRRWRWGHTLHHSCRRHFEYVEAATVVNINIPVDAAYFVFFPFGISFAIHDDLPHNKLRKYFHQLLFYDTTLLSVCGSVFQDARPEPSSAPPIISFTMIIITFFLGGEANVNVEQTPAAQHTHAHIQSYVVIRAGNVRLLTNTSSRGVVLLLHKCESTMRKRYTRCTLL